ncbi:ATP-dependent exoDNAse (exonuclease V), alpha subunit, helicase superfamily I [Methylophilus rhizosphaerae]|uniref:ATP-dependent exoDNAse (Exonuclease V), alpha subunit, helicase superfamily I n=1 Tax=Methylophilus rhizosphaerae TaxID=492660 RepID=A0A1G9A7Z6_9PROT|nr:AAA family ATPase [Methylophilus rhizosphaerae]SDK23427.1 ATP-dependent exoDNAse (exonuclease V), alpha subunit, helicase superfamily I [Methylophilus rhizosphaerae]
MIGISNVTVKSGFSYNKYLKKQLSEVVENIDWRQAYNLKDIALEATMQTALADPLALYTRSGGALFDEWKLSGHLTEEKIDMIADLQLGKDKRTEAHIKLKKTIQHIVMNDEGHAIKLTQKDLKRGFYKTPDKQKIVFKPEDVKTSTGFVKKTDIEFVFTQDSSISYAIPTMKLEDRLAAEQMLIDTAIEVHDKILKQYIKDYKGRTGESGYYLYYHNDGRSGNPSSHVHFLIPNMLKLSDGSVRAIEMDEIKDKDFHDSIDKMYKSMLVEKWNARFTDYQLEAYDKDHQTITHESNAEIHDWRVAYDEDSLQKIRANSKSKELIDQKISEAKKDLFNQHSIKVAEIEQEATAYKQLVNDNQFTLPHGYLVSHGPAKYQHIKENQNSYFVVVSDRNGKEKTFWGVDLERAIKESNVQTGDLIELNGKNKEKVKVNVPVKDDSGKIIKGKFEEKIVEKAVWHVEKSTKQIISKDIEEEINARLERLNTSYQNKLTYLDSNKNRQEVWRAIKQPKKGMAKFLKDIELAKDVSSMNLKMKKTEEIGLSFKSKKYEKILETLTNTSPFFTENGLIAELSKTQGYGAEAQVIAKKLIRGLQKREVIVDTNSLSKTQLQYTTHELIKMERENVDIMKNQFSSLQPKRVNDVANEIATIEKQTGITPNKEQKEFIESAFNDKQGQIVIGLPGSGKSLAAGWTTKIANKAGYRTIGLAPTGKVSTALANETDCNFTATIDKFNIEVANGDLKLTSNNIIFVDESSMVGTRNMHKLLKTVNEAGAKIILVGDPNQINSVATGNSLNEFLKDSELKDQVNYLVEIRRQKNDKALEIAETSALKEVYKDADLMKATKESGVHVIKVFDLLEQIGAIKNSHTTTTETIQAISKDFLEDINSFKDKLLITSTNKSIDRINNTIQERRLEAGEIFGEQFENQKGKFFIGDRIIMEKNIKDEYNNGDLGTITSIENNKITIEFDSGKIKTIDNPEQMRLGYAMSFEKSQGMTVNNAYIYGENAPNNNQELFNVGMTRARYSTKFYSTQIEHLQVVESFKRESKRVSLIELGKEIDARMKVRSLDKIIPVNQDTLAIEQTQRAIETIKQDGLKDMSDKPKLSKLKALIDNKKVKPDVVIADKPSIIPIEDKPTIEKVKSKQKMKQIIVDR